MYLNGSEFALSKLKMHYKLLLLAILLFIAPQALSKRKPARKCPGESEILSRLPWLAVLASAGEERERRALASSREVSLDTWENFEMSLNKRTVAGDSPIP